MIDQIAEMIRVEFEAFGGDEPAAETLRCVAWYVTERFPNAKVSDFGDAAVLCGRHRQGAINRWNEAMHNLAVAEGRA